MQINEQETQKIGENLAKKIKNGGVICLFGDLGTGKTTLTKAIAEQLGIKKIKIKSPTYTYIRKHIISPVQNLYHIDLYKLNEIDSLLLQEIEELMINKNNIIIIEWADRLKEYLPEKRIDVKLKYIDKNTRGIKISYE